ncbi:RNase adapter RapZ [Micavibrio aeruginosavorus]|uniref:RNase adapter RapZ n=1 Tax=Micavibrio aeruginosavorus TaxID=349221 RepID=UPI003F4AF159
MNDSPATPPLSHRPTLILTGLSGAGMTSALKALEDLGYEVFDNFPLSLIDSLVKETAHDAAPVAIGIDARSRGFDPDAILAAAKRHNAELVFLWSDESTLQKRFTETRRRHPMAKDRPVSAGIKREQEWLHPLRATANHVIDTSDMSAQDLRRQLTSLFGLARGERMTVTIMSFGFKYGVPREADIVMDIRFLANPHWIKELRPQTGLDKDVGDYVRNDPAWAPFMQNFQALIAPLLPRYQQEGKSYLTIAIGCTGGRHRSVFTTEQMHDWLEQQGYSSATLHRDIGR